MSFSLDSIPRIVGTVADDLPIVASEPLHDALDVQRERAAAQSRTEHAREPDACDPLPLAASGISAIVADDPLGAVLANYRAPRWSSKPTGPRADDVARVDRLADAVHADRIGPMAVLGSLGADAVASFVAGDATTWHALRLACSRGIRARVVRTDGRGDVATDRWEPVEPDGPEVSEALSLSWRVLSTPGNGRRRRIPPADADALTAYVRFIVRKLATGPEQRIGKRRAAAHAAVARASERSAAQVVEDREEAQRALARAVMETRSDQRNGARTRRRLADVAADFGISLNREPVPAL